MTTPQTKKGVLIVAGQYYPEYGGPAKKAKVYRDCLSAKNVDVQMLILDNKVISPTTTPVGTVTRIFLPTGNPSIFLFALCKLFIFFLKNFKKWKNIHFIGIQKRTLVVILLGFLFFKKMVLHSSLMGQDDLQTATSSRLRKFIVKKADAYLALSNEIEKSSIHVANSLGIEQHYFPNAVLPSVIGQIKQKNKRKVRKSLENRFNIPLTGPIVCFSGFVCSRKGVDFLLESWRLIEKQSNNASLIIVGPLHLPDFPENDLFISHMKNFLTSNSIKRVFFTGNLEHEKVFEIYHVADVFAFPSRREGMPSACLEAMAFNAVPILVSQEWVDCRVWKNNRTAIIVDRYDAHQYSAAVCELLENKNRMHLLGSNASALIHKSHNFENQCDWLCDNIYL